MEIILNQRAICRFLTIFIIPFLYTLIEGFINLFVPIYISQVLGYRFLWIYSFRFIAAIFSNILITKYINRIFLKNALNLGFFIILLSGILFKIQSFYTILLTIPLSGIVHPIFWGSYRAYLARISSNLKNDISKFSLSAVSGYIISGAWPILLSISRCISLCLVLFISFLLFLLSLALQKDKIPHVLNDNSSVNRRNVIKLLVAGMVLVLSFSVYFTITPVILKTIEAPVIYLSACFILFNFGQILGNLLTIKEKYNELKKFLDISLIIASAVSLLIYLFIITKHFLQLVISIFIVGCLIQLIVNNLYILEIEWLKKVIHSDYISMLLVLSAEISSMSIMTISSFLGIYSLLLPVGLFLFELWYIKTFIIKIRTQ